MADPTCVPGSTYLSPFVSDGLHDIQDDRSISALYFYPKQTKPHRSVLLPGVNRPRPKLTQQDQENTRRGGRGRGGYSGSGGLLNLLCNPRESLSACPADNRHGGSYGANGYDPRPMQHNSSYNSYAPPNGYRGGGGGGGRGVGPSLYTAGSNRGGYVPSGGYGGRGVDNSSYRGGSTYGNSYRGGVRGRR